MNGEGSFLFVQYQCPREFEYFLFAWGFKEGKQYILFLSLLPSRESSKEEHKAGTINLAALVI